MADNEIKTRFTGDASGMTKASNQASQALQTVKKSSGAANVALTDVSRVISDMPYGIRGVANNLEQLGSSLGRVNFKDFVKGLAGPGGMLIGLSLVTSALSAAEMKYGSLGAAIEALTTSNGVAISAQKDLNKAFAEATNSAGGEIAKINALLSVARDYTLGKKAQQEAIDVLNKEYDKYLPKLSLENINTQAVTTAVDKLTAALLRQAKVKGLQDLIAKEYQKQAELFQSSATDNLTVLDMIAGAFETAGNASGGMSSIMQKAGQRTSEAFDKSTQRARIFEEQLKKILSTEAIEGTLFNPDIKAPKDIKAEIPEMKLKVARVGLTFSEMLVEKSSLNKASDLLKDININVAPTTTGVTEIIRTAGEAATAIGKVNEQMLKLQETSMKVQEFLTTQLSSAFTSLFENILSGGKNAFQQFGQAIAGVIKKLIAAAVTAAIFAAIIGAATGGAKFGGGATTFLGGFKNILKSLSGLSFAQGGGITNGPTLAMIGDNPSGREAVIPFERLGEFANMIGGNGGRLEARFSRDEMIIWLQQGLDKFGRHT